ncbi:hypothetical protein F5Y05DRAFT_377379 [Hypoxylon sp. FL0543]|nr:hypothetical protein F5Y05DRAFT_377379 [Hypoxylon sp. FL0543]
MKVNSAVLALATLFAFSLNLNGVSSRAIGGGALVTDGGSHKPSAVGTRGLTGPGGSTVKGGGKGGKTGKDDPDDGGDAPSGGVGGLGSGSGVGSGSGAVIGGLGSGTMSTFDKQLDGFGLVRSQRGTAQNEGAFEDFKLTASENWNQWSIDPKPDKTATYGDEPIYQYQTVILPSGNGAFNTKVVVTANRGLPADLNRRTLTKNAWQDAGGDLGKLMVLGDSEIINDEVKQSINEALAAAGKDAGDFPLKKSFEPGDDGWTEIQNNPFIGGYQKMLSESASDFKNAQIANIAAIVDAAGEYHLLTGLTRQKRTATPPGSPPAKKPDTAEESMSESDE